MADFKTWMTYHLPRTRIRVHGTAIEKLNLRTGQREKEVSSSVTLETEADPAAFYQIDLRGSKLSDSSFSLELTDDGRLVSTEAKSTGRLGQIVRNVFGFVTTVVSAVGGLAGGAGAFVEAAAADTDVSDPVLERYRAEHPNRSERRRRITEALEAIVAKLIELENGLVAQADPGERQKAVAHIKDLKRAADGLRAEAKLLDTHFVAWKASKEAASSRTYELTVDLAGLPKISDVESWTGEPTPGQLGSSAPAYRALNLVIARSDPQPPPSGSVPTSPSAGTAYAGVFFRHARPIELALFVARGGVLEMVKKTSELVMDDNCRTGFVVFGRSRWSERSASLTFSNLGGLKKLKNSKASELAAATGTLKELPADVLASLEQANKIIDERQKLSLQGIEQRIAELEKQKSLIDKEIALDEAIDTRDLVEEQKRLKAEIDLLKARKDLGDAQRNLQLVEQGSAIQLETEILKLRVGLEKAQVERLKTEAELEKLQAEK